MQPVFRVESQGEVAVPFPSLADAMRIGPSHPESRIATSATGLLLAEAVPVGGSGTVLKWELTLAGRDVRDKAGWTAGAPVLSEREYDILLDIALREDFARLAS